MPPGSTLICFRSAPAQKMYPFGLAPCEHAHPDLIVILDLIDRGLDALSDVGVDRVPRLHQVG